MEENKSKNCNAKELPTQQYLIECFDYDPEVGDLIWKIRPRKHFEGNERYMKIFNSQFANKIAGNLNKINGYVNVIIDGVVYKSHRLIWKMTYNEEPDTIDHINGIRNDNRLVNLRNITFSMNTKNRRVGSKNKSGYLGVYFCNTSKRWKAEIRIDGKRKTIGYYDTEHLAALARELKFRETVGEDFYNESGRDIILKEIQDIVNNSDNKYNLNLTSRNKTGYPGVSITKEGLYKTSIKIDKKSVHLGYYNTAEEAALVYQLKFKEIKGDEYYKEYCRDGLLEDLQKKIEDIKNTIGLTKDNPKQRKKYIFTEEHKKNISEAQKGKEISEYTRQKLLEANVGRKHKPETIEKLKVPHSKEHNKKVSEARLAKRLPYDELPNTIEEACERGVFLLKQTEPCKNNHLYAYPVDKITGKLRQCLLCRYETKNRLK